MHAPLAQGFGRLDLSGSLPLAGDARGWRLQLVDNASFAEDGIEHNYTVTVPPSPAGAIDPGKPDDCPGWV
jgi:hypothetical protein